MKKLLSHIAGMICIIAVTGGCSTEKNTRASRTYHNITSYYNVYFNGYESMRSGLSNIEENLQDDYTRILPIYKESSPSAARMVKSDMENAVIKASKLIEIHSITTKPKRQRIRSRKYQEFASREEFNKWIDDSYILMGRAFFYQHNFAAAISNFSYVIRKYPEEESHYEAYVWLIRSYSELERFVEAYEVIQAVQGDDNFPKKLEKELAAATADYYMKQQEYNEAIKFLNIAISKTFWKKQKARYQYIVAQLYQQTGQSAKASEAFSQVVKMNPDYKMAFNAMINAAGVFSGSGDPEKLKKELNRMLRDKKNIDFQDQIYFALGNLFMNQGDRETAVENYRKSVANSFSNQYQRALSAITLGDLYFEDLNYENAQAYYDSAMIIIDENYPGYTEISSKYKSLSNLVDNLLTVTRQDSLQKIAKMPENEREALINSIIKAEQEKQRNQENLALQGQRDQGYYRSNRYRMGMGSDQSGAGWYFYNPQTVSYGRVTFQQRWGRRTLEDDWRRSNKTSVSPDAEEEMAEITDSSQMVVREVDPLKKEFYTQDLPITDSLMQISHEKIRDALYNAGKIFKSEYNNYERAAACFEDLISRYPGNIYLLSALFDLYDLYELMGNTAKSAEYRNQIITRFPDSNYARYLVNPNFFVEMEARMDTLNQLYERLFQDYRAGRYLSVIPVSASVKNMNPDSVMLSKVDFMNTVARGTQTDVHQFEQYLKDYLKNYPDAEPAPLAGEILTLIQDSALADYQKLVEMGYISEEIQNEELLTQGTNINDEFGGKFSYEEDLLHYFVIAFPRNAKVDLNRLKFDIANYNIDHYTKIDFDIETENLDDKTMFLLVRVLENKENALIYHRAIIRKAPVFQALKDINYVNFVASSTNYRQIMEEKSMADYLKFFVKNYSRFIGPDFSDDESETSPEELMARARQEEEALRERGNFVVVNSGVSSLFNSQIDTMQNFVLAVKDAGSAVRQVMAGFGQFNRTEFRAWSLGLQLKSASGYQLIIVNGIPSLNEAMSYFRKVVITRNLFEPLGRATYRNFLVTGENLEKIISGNKVDEYLDFFRNNYIQKTQSTESATPVPTPENTAEKDFPDTQELQNVPAEPEVTQSPYNENVEGKHLFVLVVPLEGIDKEQLIQGIAAFNNTGFGNLDLKTEEKPLDNFRQLITVSGLPDKQLALRYFANLVQNRDLFKPLGSATYRNFLISEQNMGIFLNQKNIIEYMDFYKKIYLEQ